MAIDKITTPAIADGAVSADTLTSTVITGQTAETSIATDDLILLSDTSASGALRKMTRANFVSGVGGANTPAFGAEMNYGNTQISNKNTATLCPFQNEILDTDGAYNNGAGEYKFTPQTAGKYFVYSHLNIYADGNLQTISAMLYKNGSEHHPFRAAGFSSAQADYYLTSTTYTGIISFNGSSDYVQIYISANWGGTGNFYLNSRPTFGAFRIIE